MSGYGSEFQSSESEQEAGVLSHLQNWIAEQDMIFTSELNRIQDEVPNILNSNVEILRAIRDAAKLTGRKELLDELKYEFSQKDTPSQI